MKSERSTYNNKECFFCGRTDGLERHHAFFGNKNRNNSETYADCCCFWLCHEHHQGNNGVHRNREMADALRQVAEMKFLETHSFQEWMEIFGKNYLETIS